MEEIIGAEILNRADVSRDLYKTKLRDGSIGVVFKKTGNLKLTLNSGAVDFYVSKVSGNGSFSINGTFYNVGKNVEKISINTESGEIFINRTVDSVGMICLTKIVQEECSNNYDIKEEITIFDKNVKNLKKHQCSGVSIDSEGKKIIAQRGAEIKGDVLIKTNPEGCYIKDLNKTKFPINCEIVQFGSEQEEKVYVENKELVKRDDMKQIYSGKGSKFSNIKRLKGVFRILGNVNKALLLHAASEISIPIQSEKYIKVIITAQPASRSSVYLDVGIGSDKITFQRLDFIKNSSISYACFDASSFGKAGNLVVQCSNVDSTIIKDIEIKEVDEKEYEKYLQEIKFKQSILNSPRRKFAYQEEVNKVDKVDKKIDDLILKKKSLFIDNVVDGAVCSGNTYKVSIVMSLKNRTKFLKYSLETLCKQTMPTSQFELVVVDDGSTEDMFGFLKSYSNRLNIKYIKIDSTKSEIPIWSHTPSLSNNVGFKNAEGEVILICGPEILHKNTNLEIAYKAAQKNVAAFGLVWHSNLKFVNNVFDNFDPKSTSFDMYLNIPGGKANCITKNTFYWYLLAVKKEHVIKIGGVDEEYGRGVCGEDDNFAARLQVSGCTNAHEFEMEAIHMEHESGDDKYDERRHRETNEWQAARKLNVDRWHAWNKSREILANVGKDWGSNKVISDYFKMNNNLLYDYKKYDVITNYNLNMKILYLSLGYQPGVESAFKKFGVELNVFDFWSKYIVKKQSVENINLELLKVAQDFKPDMIHMQLQYTGVINEDTIRKLKKILPKVIIINWTGDVRQNIPNYFVNIGKVVDYTLICNTGQIPELKKCNNVNYWQIGVDTNLCFPQNKKKFKYDCCFIGNCYKNFPGFKQRVIFCKTLKEKYKDKMGLFGSGWGNQSNGSIEWADVNNVYNDSRVVISISNFNNIDNYFSDRFLMGLASGRPVLSYRFPGIEKYIVNGVNGYIMDSINDGINNFEKIINQPDDILNDVGYRGSKLVLDNHTFVSRIQELFKMVGII